LEGEFGIRAVEPGQGFFAVLRVEEILDSSRDHAACKLLDAFVAI